VHIGTVTSAISTSIAPARSSAYGRPFETLDHVEIAELRGDQRSFAAAQQRSDGMLGAEQRLSQLNVATDLSRDAGERVEVIRRRVGHDVTVLRSPYNPPRSERQATDHDEANIRPHEASEKLIKRRSAQRARRAASRNSNSLRVSEIVSLRFTPSGLCPSARSRSRRTRSPSTSGDRSLGCSTIELNTTEPVIPKPAKTGIVLRRQPASADRDGMVGKVLEISLAPDPEAPRGAIRTQDRLGAWRPLGAAAMITRLWLKLLGSAT
jgi:hypothetical protein